MTECCEQDIANERVPVIAVDFEVLHQGRVWPVTVEEEVVYQSKERNKVASKIRTRENNIDSFISCAAE